MRPENSRRIEPVSSKDSASFRLDSSDILYRHLARLQGPLLSRPWPFKSCSLNLQQFTSTTWCHISRTQTNHNQLNCILRATYSAAYFTLNGTVVTVSQSSALLALPKTLNPDTASWYVPSGSTVPSAIRPLKKAARFSFGAYGTG